MPETAHYWTTSPPDDTDPLEEPIELCLGLADEIENAVKHRTSPRWARDQEARAIRALVEAIGERVDRKRLRELLRGDVDESAPIAKLPPGVPDARD